MRKASGDLTTSFSPADAAARRRDQQQQLPAATNPSAVHPGAATAEVTAGTGQGWWQPQSHACPSTRSQAAMPDAQFPLPAPRCSTHGHRSHVPCPQSPSTPGGTRAGDKILFAAGRTATRSRATVPKPREILQGQKRCIRGEQPRGSSASLVEKKKSNFKPSGERPPCLEHWGVSLQPRKQGGETG